MARRITLTRDERILLQAATENGGALPATLVSVAPWKLDQLITKLEHRGLLGDAGTITSEGQRALAESRKTTPKVAQA